MSLWCKIWGWLKDYWYVPLLVLGTFFAWVFLRKGDTWPIERVKVELEAIAAQAKIRDVEAAMGRDKAKAAIENNYLAEMNHLNEKQKEQAAELEDDPAKLAKFLVRAGRMSGPG